MIDAIHRELDKSICVLANRAVGALAAPVGYAVAGGKRARGLLLVLAGEGRTAVPELLRAAACLELLHAATLVQDDIFDGSRTRRGRPAVHRVFGPQLATLASDWMLAEAMRAAYRFHAGYGEALSACAEAMIAGEAREFAPCGPTDAVSLRADAAAIAGAKTGELFGLALSASSVLEGKASEAARLREVGCALGNAFQYLDDALDLYGDVREAGKDLRRDAAAGLWTLPILDAWVMRGQKPQAGMDPLPDRSEALSVAMSLRGFVLVRARSQWQEALQGVLEELPHPCPAVTLLKGIAEAMLAPSEVLETCSAA